MRSIQTYAKKTGFMLVSRAFDILLVYCVMIPDKYGDGIHVPPKTIESARFKNYVLGCVYQLLPASTYLVERETLRNTTPSTQRLDMDSSALLCLYIVHTSSIMVRTPRIK